MIAALPQIERAEAATRQARELIGMIRTADAEEAERAQRVAIEVDMATKHLQEALHHARATPTEGGDDGGN